MNIVPSKDKKEKIIADDLLSAERLKNDEALEIIKKLKQNM